MVYGWRRKVWDWYKNASPLTMGCHDTWFRRTITLFSLQLLGIVHKTCRVHCIANTSMYLSYKKKCEWGYTSGEVFILYTSWLFPEILMLKRIILIHIMVCSKSICKVFCPFYFGIQGIFSTQFWSTLTLYKIS